MSNHGEKTSCAECGKEYVQDFPQEVLDDPNECDPDLRLICPQCRRLPKYGGIEPTSELPVREYNPHVVVVWTSATTIAAQEYSCKEDAEEKYEALVQARFKVVLAKVVKAHGEG